MPRNNDCVPYMNGVLMQSRDIVRAASCTGTLLFDDPYYHCDTAHSSFTIPQMFPHRAHLGESRYRDNIVVIHIT